jgi:hypothetical protein
VGSLHSINQISSGEHAYVLPLLWPNEPQTIKAQLKRVSLPASSTAQARGAMLSPLQKKECSSQNKKLQQVRIYILIVLKLCLHITVIHVL